MASASKRGEITHLIYVDVLVVQSDQIENFRNGINRSDPHMTRFNTDDGSAHKFSQNVEPPRLGASTGRQNAQSRTISDATGVSSGGRRIAPLRERRLQRGETLRTDVRTNGVVHRNYGASELDGNDLI